MSAEQLDMILLTQDATASDVFQSLKGAAWSTQVCVRVVTLVGPPVANLDVAQLIDTHGVRVKTQTTWPALGATSADSETDATWTAVIRAGDQLTQNSLDELGRDIREGIDQQIYALVPTTGYRPTKSLGKLNSVYVDRHERRTWTGSPGFVLRTSLLNSCKLYDLNSPIGHIQLFLESLLKCARFRVVRRGVALSRPLEDRYSNEPCLYNPAWYHDLNTFFGSLIKSALEDQGSLPRYFQFAYTYLAWYRFRYNRNTANKMVLRDDLDSFLGDVGRILSQLEIDAIVDPTINKLDLQVRDFMISLSGRAQDTRARYYANEVSLTVDNCAYVSAADVPLRIETMDIAGNLLKIDGRYDFPSTADDEVVEVEYAGETFVVNRTQRHSSTTVFGRPAHTGMAFTISIPLESGVVRAVRFFYNVPGRSARVLLDPTFSRPASRLTRDKRQYWAVGEYLLYYRSNRIVVRPRSKKQELRREFGLLRSLLRKRNKRMMKVAATRILYFIARPYLRRRPIWIFFDKLYKAGDNGEYAYRAAREHRDGIRKYYILRKDTDEARRFRKLGIPYVAYGSIRHRVLFLNATTVFTTHINPQNFGGFHGGLEKYFRGLFHYKTICIQHGLSVQDLSSTLNQVYDNTSYFCVASGIERLNLTQSAYAYDASRVVATGLARYDGLVDQRKRQILIAPTWRTYLAGPYRMGQARGYSQVFRNSRYYQIYRELISDQELLECARRNRYRIVFLLHPVISSQVNDFESNDVVEVVASTSDVTYEEMLRTSALMVTDYSGIQFDFAYMYKPVVYLHHPEIPPSYTEGSYVYGTMALGDICVTVDSLVSTVCGYVENDCAMSDEYRQRCEEFFEHHDRENAERVYQVGLLCEGLRAGPGGQGAAA